MAEYYRKRLPLDVLSTSEWDAIVDKAIGKAPQDAEPTDGETTFVISEEFIPTIELLRERFNIPDDWVVKNATANIWPVGAKIKDPKTGVERIISKPLHQLKASFSPPASSSFAIFKDALLSGISEPSHTPVYFPEQITKRTAVINLNDFHLGKNPVSGEWDIDTCKQHFSAAITKFMADIQKAGNVDTILFPFGNDFMHYDNRSYQTTKGTPMSHLGVSWPMLLAHASIMHAEAFIRLSQIAKVVAIPVTGNHDWHSTIALSEIFKSQFDKHPTIKILETKDVSNPIQYYMANSVMIAFWHGDTGKAAKMPSIMALSQKEMWAKAKSYVVYTAHYHKKAEYMILLNDEHTGVRFKVCPSLSPTDDWHRENMFTGNQRSSQCDIYDEEKQILETYYDIIK